MNFPIKTQGVSLIELLIAMGLASFLLAAIWQVYFYFRHAHDHLEQQMNVNYELQLVIALLRDSIRRAGFTPCMPLNSLWNKEGLRAYQIQDTTLTLNRMGEPIYLAQVNDSSHVVIKNEPKFNCAKTYLIADCYHAELIHINMHRNVKNEKLQLELATPLHYDYFPPVYLGEWLNETYYLRQQPTPALMFKHQHAEVLSPEVRVFHIKEKLFHGLTYLFVTIGLNTVKAEQHLLVRMRAT